MAPSHLARSAKPPSGRYLSFAEREEVALLRVEELGVREVARRLGRAASTISRGWTHCVQPAERGDPKRGAGLPRDGGEVARREGGTSSETREVGDEHDLRSYVEERRADIVVSPGGTAAPGPSVPWKTRRHGRRQHRRWGRAWSPQQIAERLRLDYPEDTTMRISHEAIYQALYVQGRGALKRELTQYLRTGRALRVPRARARARARSRGCGKLFVTPEILISERPGEAEDRAVPGHWEGT